MRPFIAVLTLCWIGPGVRPAFADERPAKPAVAEVLEDNGEALLKLLTNPPFEGQGFVEPKIVFSGKSSVKIIPLQRYTPVINGWAYRVTEKPKPGEYRYLRLAWRGDGCAGIMIQLHEAKRTWYARYLAGVNTAGHWHPTKVVAQKPRGDWEMWTFDLYKDYGEGTYTGMALTVFGNQPGYFDHIYLARTVDELDRIDATGLRKGKPPAVTADDLQNFWRDLAGTSDDKGYRAFWTLVATPEQALPFLEKQLTDTKGKSHLKEIKLWIAQLGHDKFAVREQAMKHLEKHISEAADLLEQQLDKAGSPEVFLRIEKLLTLRKGPEIETLRIEKAVRAIEYVATPAARQCLSRLARDAAAPLVQTMAAAALKRLGS